MAALDRTQRVKVTGPAVIEAWDAAFPDVNIAGELAKADAWAVANSVTRSPKGWARTPHAAGGRNEVDSGEGLGGDMPGVCGSFHEYKDVPQDRAGVRVQDLPAFAGGEGGEMNRVRIKAAWAGGLREGTQIGVPVFIGQSWTPVLWDGDEDPDWHKTAGLEEASTSWAPAKEAKP